MTNQVPFANLQARSKTRILFIPFPSTLGILGKITRLIDKIMTYESYEKFQRSMCQADPRLGQLNQSAALSAWLPWHLARPRVVALHLGPDGSFVPVAEYSDSNELQAFLRQRTGSTGTPQCSVYILESLSREFITVLGEHFQLHPAVFVDHERLVAFSDRVTGEGGGIPFLPSSIHGRDHISLKYHEPLLLSTLPTDFRNLCDTSGRHIAATRIMGKFSKVGVARRKCTFWSSKNKAGGWDCESHTCMAYHRLVC